MHADARRGRCRAGFSLIEILVALAIAGAVLGMVAGTLRRGGEAALRAGRIEEALLVAQARLAAAGTEEPLVAGRSQGLAAERYPWEMTIESVDLPLPVAGPAPKVFRIAIVVTWREGRAERRLDLATHRLALGAR
jgi:general secretion pathway protein I